MDETGSFLLISGNGKLDTGSHTRGRPLFKVFQTPRIHIRPMKRSEIDQVVLNIVVKSSFAPMLFDVR